MHLLLYIHTRTQISGVRFMWENIIQSVKKVRSGDKGLGCILAHTMGLGKTFQVNLPGYIYTAFSLKFLPIHVEGHDNLFDGTIHDSVMK